VIIVTGSAGFVGKALVASLMSDEKMVVGYDKRTGVDLASDHPLHALLFDISPMCIVHLASSVSSPGSITNPEQTFRDTVTTTVNVMKYAAQTKTPVILTSSVKARDGRTPYGAAKVMAETWAIEMAKLHDIPLVINRPGTIYGPGQEGSTESGWIAWFLKAAKEDLEVTISGNGEQVRDLLHVDDYVKLLRLQIDDVWAREPSGANDNSVPRFPTYGVHVGANPPSIWDVGGGRENATSVKMMAERLRLKYKFGPERYGDAWQYIGHNRVPGWKPTTRWESLGEFNP
jgi:nucleoside-diphosphate-sugar epimerase